MPKVNVILHGLMAIAEMPDNSLQVFLPNVTEVHVFRAGFWLAETEIVPSRQPYELTGVATTGNAQFDRTMNVHLGNVAIPATAGAAAHAVLKLPRPGEIRTIRTVEIDPANDFGGQDANRVTSGRIATAQILVYDCDAIRNVQLTPHDFEPPQADNISSLNIHVFAEEELPSQGTIKHALDAFNAMVKGVTGLDVTMTTAQQVPDFDAALDHLPETVDPLESEDFSKRQSRLKNFGDILRDVLPVVRSKPAISLTSGSLLTPFGDGHPIGSKMGSCTMVLFSAT